MGLGREMRLRDKDGFQREMGFRERDGFLEVDG